MINAIKRASYGVMCFAFTLCAFAADAPYDESADAPAAVAQAQRAAVAAHKPLLIVFGANWCTDCRALDTEFKRADTAKLVTQKFVIVKVDVGHFDKNLELSKRFGDPIKKGIPAVVIVNADGRDVYATRAGELASARKMGGEAIRSFFEKVIAREKL